MQSDDRQAGGETSPQQKQSFKASKVLDRNISALLEQRRRDAEGLGREDRLAGTISRFAGSMHFVYLHLLLFGGWIVANLGWLPFIPVFDPSLVILAMAASVEAIFISTFVMINQNRMAREEDKRAELSLQISLLAEHETTKLVSMVSAITKHLGIPVEVAEGEIEEMKRNIPPETILDEIERVKDAAGDADRASSSSSRPPSSSSSSS
jgi:uncharacterized membrane protein